MVGGSPDGFHGDDSNGYSIYSDCLVYVCDARNEKLGTRIFWGGIEKEDPGQFNKICFPNPLRLSLIPRLHVLPPSLSLSLSLSSSGKWER